jgi:hypothetical protein
VPQIVGNCWVHQALGENNLVQDLQYFINCSTLSQKTIYRNHSPGTSFYGIGYKERVFLLPKVIMTMRALRSVKELLLRRLKYVLKNTKGICKPFV